MQDLTQLKFLETHEWVRVEGTVGTVGISDFAQKEISDIVFVELPKVGKHVKLKESCMVIESVKAAFDIYAPVSGTILEANTALAKEPERVNRSPYEEGWLFKIEIENPEELKSLLDWDAYHQRARS